MSGMISTVAVPAQGERHRLIELFGLTIVLLLAAFLRFHGIGKHCFWIDEAYSVSMAAGTPAQDFAPPANQFLPNGFFPADPKRGSAADVIRAMERDKHPPLYQLMIRAWRQWFGTGDAATRSLSAVAGLAAIVLLWDAVRNLHGPVPAWWAAAMMAVATPQIDYSQEARGYTLLVMWGVAAFSAVSRLIRSGPNGRRQVALALSLIGGMATHYYFIATFLAIMIFGLLQPRQVRIAIWRSGIAAIMVAAVALGPLFRIQQRTFNQGFEWISDNRPNPILRTIGRMMVTPLRWFMSPMVASSAWAVMFSGVLIMPWFLIRRRPTFALWLLAAAASLGIVAAADVCNRSRSLEEVRYTLPAAAPAYALAAALLAERRGLLRHIVPATLVLGGIICLPQAYEQSRKVNWDVLARATAAFDPPSTPLVFYEDNMSYDDCNPILQVGVTRYYDLWKHPMVALTRTATPAIVRELKARGTFLVIRSFGKRPVVDFVPGCVSTGRVFTTAVVGDVSEYRFPD